MRGLEEVAEVEYFALWHWMIKGNQYWLGQRGVRYLPSMTGIRLSFGARMNTNEVEGRQGRTNASSNPSP
jgi:hypothetical protein